MRLEEVLYLEDDGDEGVEEGIVGLEVDCFESDEHLLSDVFQQDLK